MTTTKISLKQFLSFMVPLKDCQMESRVPVTHACNLSYSGGRDQKDLGSKPVQANSLQDPISKNPSQKQIRAGGVAQGEGPGFKHQYHTHTKKNIVKRSSILDI
jgi:hypothetical protein